MVVRNLNSHWKSTGWMTDGMVRGSAPPAGIVNLYHLVLPESRACSITSIWQQIPARLARSWLGGSADSSSGHMRPATWCSVVHSLQGTNGVPVAVFWMMYHSLMLCLGPLQTSFLPGPWWSWQPSTQPVYQLEEAFQRWTIPPPESEKHLPRVIFLTSGRWAMPEFVLHFRRGVLNSLGH